MLPLSLSGVKPRRFLLSTLAFLLCSCANHHFQVAAGGPPSNAPRYVELEQEKQVATMHFPAGTYTFYAMDDAGYYYRAPRPIIQHTGGASIGHNGGLYVNKRDPRKVRGYVYMPGGLTHLGDFSHTKHELRN